MVSLGRDEHDLCCLNKKAINQVIFSTFVMSGRYHTNIFKVRCEYIPSSRSASKPVLVAIDKYTRYSLLVVFITLQFTS